VGSPTFDSTFIYPKGVKNTSFVDLLFNIRVVEFFVRLSTKSLTHF
jgi:hypothetical protein